MSTTAINSFRPLVQLELQACPGVTLDQIAVNACRTFAADTWAHTAFNPTITSLPQTQSYGLTPPDAYHEVFAIASVGMSQNGGEETMLFPCDGNDRLVDTQTYATPKWFWLDMVKGLMLYPIPPDGSYTFTVNMVLRPIQGASQVDSRYMTQFSDPIQFWMLYRAKVTSGQPWSDPNGAKLDYAQYQFTKQVFRNRLLAGNVQNAARVTTNFY